MSAGDGSGGTYNYGRARVAGGLALIFVVVVLAIIDAAFESYQLEPILAGLLVGTGSVLLGVDVIIPRVLGK